MSSSCQNLLAALKDCILHSDCVRKDNRLPSDCLRNHSSDLPEECQSLRKATFECKRGMLDMRKRFRGNTVGANFDYKPSESGKENGHIPLQRPFFNVYKASPPVSTPSPYMSDDKRTITLYTASTPNGFCPQILLEELKLVYPSFTYEAVKVELSKNVQKEPWFLKLNPNGRIPVLVDHQRDGQVVFETSAIVLYIVQHYDKDHHFWFNPAKDANSYSDMLQWIFFTHGGVGPMTGQLAHFANYAAEQIPYAKKRYLDETKRLYGVLEGHLKGREYLAGPDKGKFSVADIKTFPWIGIHTRVGIELDEFPNVKAYLERCKAREGTQAGYKVAA